MSEPSRRPKRSTSPRKALPSLSIVIESTTWKSAGHYGLPHLLGALRSQSYPQELIEIIVPMKDRMRAHWDQLKPLPAAVRIVHIADTLNYYQLKHAGVEHTTGDIVAFLDADNSVVSDWAEQMVGPFIEHPEVTAVHGRSRFRRTTLSRVWDAVWWTPAFEQEGEIDRIYATNNIAFRGDFIRRHYYADPSLTRRVWERVMSERVDAEAGKIWLNSSAIWYHDMDAGLRSTIQRALSRGATLVYSRKNAPKPSEHWQRRFIHLFPFLGLPFLVAKDIWRVVRTAPANDLPGRQLWKVPLYGLAIIVLDLFVLPGMLLAAYADKQIAPP